VVVNATNAGHVYAYANATDDANGGNVTLGTVQVVASAADGSKDAYCLRQLIMPRRQEPGVEWIQVTPTPPPPPITSRPPM
jgi:hypothetical protein